jgi:hypothetical protein
MVDFEQRQVERLYRFQNTKSPELHFRTLLGEEAPEVELTLV